jgi:hypothetical protein
MLKFATKFTLLLTLVFTCSVGDCAADEEFDAVFEATEFPWFDAENGTLNGGVKPPRPESRVAGRGEIPLAKTKTVTPVQPNTAAAPAAAPANGASVGTLFANWMVYIAAGLALAGLIALLVYGFLQRESGGSSGDDESGSSKRRIRDHIRHLPFEVEEQEGDFETFADRAFANGDYSKSVIYLFADLLAGLNESGLIRLQRGKTNRQYLNEIYDRKEVSTYYKTVMTAFEDAFFGKHHISKERAECCLSGRADFNQTIERIKQEKFSAARAPTVEPNKSFAVEPLS